jgi:hypothetical protein
MGHQLPLGAGAECFRFAPMSGPYLKLIDWPKGAMCGRLRVGKDFLHAADLVGAAMCGSHDRWP